MTNPAIKANYLVETSYDDEGTLSVFDAQTYSPLAEIPCGEYPEGINASLDGKYVYVANWFDNVLTKIDAASLKIAGKVETGDGPRAFGGFIRRTP